MQKQKQIPSRNDRKPLDEQLRNFSDDSPAKLT